MRFARAAAWAGAAAAAAALAAAGLPSAQAAPPTGTQASAQVAAPGRLVPGPPGAQHLLGESQVRRLGRPDGVAADASPAVVARAFALQNARALGVTGQLAAARSTPTPAGTSVVRLAQTFSGVPVVGGEVVVEVGADGSPVGALSETAASAPALGLSPALDAPQAADLAVGYSARGNGVDRSVLSASTPVLSVYEPSMLGAPGIPGSRLVWRTEVTSISGPEIKDLVLVDAMRPVVALSFSEIDHALERHVCDAANATGAEVPCTAARYEAIPSANPDVQSAYDLAGATYQFYRDVLGRDSVDGNGMPLLSTVRYCEPGYACPFRNAFWNGSQMVYGDGFASADDVVAHELTHGVTQYTSRLYYFFQSGAINESISDVMGEIVDLTDGIGTDTPAVRWKLGEDLPASIGVIRDMADPTLFGDPDSTASPLYASGLFQGAVSDGGGVHTNSGVGNKFASLLVDGGTFRGKTVSGIGTTKTARVVYQAMNLMTSAADYRQYAAALRQGCASLQAAGDVTTADCAQVDAAVVAVGMDVTPANAALPPAPAACPQPGARAIVTSTESFETDPSGSWSAPGWYWSGGTNPYGVDQRYATDGQQNLWGDDSATSGVSRIVGPPLPTKANSFILLDHAWSFDSDATHHYDAGRFDVIAPDGVTFDPMNHMVNGYNGTVSDVPTGFPGFPAFVGTSKGYVTTRIDSGFTDYPTLRLALYIGRDNGYGDYGWFIDRIRNGYCDLAAPSLTLSAPVASVSPSTFAIAASDDGELASLTLQRRSAGARSALPTAWSSPVALRTTAKAAAVGTAPGTVYCAKVVARDRAARMSFRTSCTAVPLDDRSLSRSGRWTAVADAKAYKGTLLRSTTPGASLTYSGVRGSGLAVVVKGKKRSGSVFVYVNGKLLTAVLTGDYSLQAPAYRKVLRIKTPVMNGATVKIVLDRPGMDGVEIDGLAVLKS